MHGDIECCKMLIVIQVFGDDCGFVRSNERMGVNITCDDLRCSNPGGGVLNSDFALPGVVGELMASIRPLTGNCTTCVVNNLFPSCE